jgi:hypothetical protein
VSNDQEAKPKAAERPHWRFEDLEFGHRLASWWQSFIASLKNSIESTSINMRINSAQLAFPSRIILLGP